MPFTIFKMFRLRKNLNEYQNIHRPSTIEKKISPQSRSFLKNKKKKRMSRNVLYHYIIFLLIIIVKIKIK